MKVKANSTIILAILCTAAVLTSCTQKEQKPETIGTNNVDTSTEASTNGPGEGVTQQNTAKPEAKAGAHEGTVSGVISDSMCASDHSKMGDLGKDAQACSLKCVEGGAKYVVVAENGIVYNLSDQKRVKKFGGKSVVISGHIDDSTKSIHLHSIEGK